MEVANLVCNVFFATIFQKREMFPDLAPLMWHSFGTMFVLLQVCSNPCALLCILIVWSSLLGALSVFFHVLFPWSICYVSHSWFNPRVHGYISFLNLCLWSLNQSVQPFGLTTYLVCLSTWKKKQEIMSFYPALSPPMLSASVTNRACNVLALLQVWF